MATAVQTFESSRTATAGKLDAEEPRYGRGALVGAVVGIAIEATPPMIAAAWSWPSERTINAIGSPLAEK